MSPQISVIVPVYNGARLVTRALDSALAQSLTPLEIIAVDDGSTDDTPLVLARYGRRIRRLRIAHGGVSCARNAGIAASRGELLAFLDADDVWHADKLARQAEAMWRWPHAGLCCCDYWVWHRSRGHQVRHFAEALPQARLSATRQVLPAPLAALVRCNFIGTASSVMLRRALALHIGPFDPALRQAEDYDYWLRCALQASFIVLPEALLDKRSHDANLTNRAVETAQYHEQVLQKWLTAGALTAEAQALLPQALRLVRYNIARQLAREGQTRAALHYCLRGWRSDPAPGRLPQAGHTLLRCLLHLARARRRPAGGRAAWRA